MKRVNVALSGHLDHLRSSKVNAANAHQGHVANQEPPGHKVDMAPRAHPEIGVEMANQDARATQAAQGHPASLAPLAIMDSLVNLEAQGPREVRASLDRRVPQVREDQRGRAVSPEETV